MIDNFYQQFEDKYRGSRESIKSRLVLYLPFITPFLLPEDPDNKLVDLGCGRGEWLELLQEIGFPAYGVELNKDQINFCRKLNLKVEDANAINWVCEQPNESVSIISAFHLVEHLKFEELKKLVSEAHRVLKPGGLLIMETPNPENIFVGACNFYLDPTHERPIPHELLSFLPEYYGYERINVIRKNGAKVPSNTSNINLSDVVFNVGLDYAVFAQKSGMPRIAKELEPLFEKEECLGLHILSRKYDNVKNEQVRYSLELINNLRSDLRNVDDAQKEQMRYSLELINNLSIDLKDLRNDLKSADDARNKQVRHSLESLNNTIASIDHKIDGLAIEVHSLHFRNKCRLLVNKMKRHFFIGSRVIAFGRFFISRALRKIRPQQKFVVSNISNNNCEVIQNVSGDSKVIPGALSVEQIVKSTSTTN